MEDGFVIRIGEELLKSDEGWHWSGYHATTSEFREARIFGSVEDAKAYYKKYGEVIQNTGIVDYMKLSLELV